MSYLKEIKQNKFAKNGKENLEIFVINGYALKFQI